MRWKSSENWILDVTSNDFFLHPKDANVRGRVTSQPGLTRTITRGLGRLNKYEALLLIKRNAMAHWKSSDPAS